MVDSSAGGARRSSVCSLQRGQGARVPIISAGKVKEPPHSAQMPGKRLVGFIALAEIPENVAAVTPLRIFRLARMPDPGIILRQ